MNKIAVKIECPEHKLQINFPKKLGWTKSFVFFIIRRIIKQWGFSYHIWNDNFIFYYKEKSKSFVPNKTLRINSESNN